MIELGHPRLSIVRQCELASISRSSFYREPTAVSEATQPLMRWAPSRPSSDAEDGLGADLGRHRYTVRLPPVTELMVRRFGELYAISHCIKTGLMNRTAVRYAVLSAALFGLSTPAAKLLVGSIPPVTLAGLLYRGAGVGLAALRRILPSIVSGARPRQFEVRLSIQGREILKNIRTLRKRFEQ
jgi:hypothetical protein